MKKSILSASIAAMIGGLGFAGLVNAGVHTPAAVAGGAPGAANALAINEAGTGHILVVPYFTTQGTNATLLNITNTDTSNGKLVKIRFRGASNSDDIFDFTLALSPGDVWAAKISQGADGRSQLETSDKSCTLPAFVATQKNSFPTSRLNPALTDAQKANETREGYIEILTMADIAKATNNNQYANGSTPPADNPLYTATKHVTGVAPCTTATLNLLKSDSTAYATTPAAPATSVLDTSTAQGKGLSYPTGKLMANWTIIDTVKTATFSGAATAVRAFNNSTPANAITAADIAGSVYGNVVFFPQSDDLIPNAANTALDSLTSDPLLRSANRTATNPADGSPYTPPAAPFIAASYYDLPDLSTPYLAGTTDPRDQAQALTAALAAKSVINEYLTTTSISATTDWVFSMPTRRYNVAVNYRFTSPLSTNSRVYTGWTNNYFSSANTALVNGQVCVNADTGSAGVNQWDREETTTSSQFVISPGTVNNVRFCGETSVLAINNGTNTSSGSLSASVALQNLNVNANEGWISLGTSGLSSQGLPVLGAAFAKSSAFGAVWPHRYTR